MCVVFLAATFLCLTTVFLALVCVAFAAGAVIGAAAGAVAGAAAGAPVWAEAGVEITAKGMARTAALARMDRNFFKVNSECWKSGYSHFA